MFAAVAILSAMALALSASSPSQSAASSLGDRKQGMKLSRSRRSPSPSPCSPWPRPRRLRREERGRDRQDAKPLSLTLDFYPNPDHAGIYMAQKLGYFAEAGLDVEIQTPSDPAAPIKLVAAGRTDLAISYEPEVMLAREQGLDVKSPSAALVNRPLTSMIWLKKSGDQAIADLRGKTIATAGIPYQDAYLKTILARAEHSRPQTSRRSTSASACCRRCSAAGPRRCSAASATSRASTCACAARIRWSPRSTSSACRPTTSWCSSPSARRLEEDPQAIRLFIAALARGTAAAAQNPQAATKALLEANPRPRSEADPGRGGGDAAAARPARAASSPTATWIPAQWTRIQRLDARQRTDRRPAASRRSCSATTTCRAAIPE